MTKFMTALFLALLLSMAQPWIAANAQCCPCPSDCSCPLFGCLCGAIGDKCCDACPCNVKFVTADAPAETKSCPADDSGTPFFGADGKQCGWLCHAEMKYYPLMPSGNFGIACAIPKGVTAARSTSVNGSSTSTTYTDPLAPSGSACANGQCGGNQSTGRAGLFGRRH